MKENKKKKVINIVENFDKKIDDTKSRLCKLEERKEAIIAESVVETLKESNYTLGDFFRIMEKQNAEKTAAQTTNTDTGSNLFQHTKTENNFNGGKHE